MVRPYMPDSKESDKQPCQIIKFDDSFKNAGRMYPIVDMVIEAHISKAIASLTDWYQHGKEVTTSLLALQGAGRQSDLVMYYKNGNCSLYEKTVTKSKFYLDITIRDTNLIKWLTEKLSNGGVVDTSLFVNLHTPYQFYLKQQQYVIVNTYLKLKNVVIHQNNTLIVTLEEV